jgi:hypothetical protein
VEGEKVPSDTELITGTVTVPRGIWTDVLEYAARRASEYANKFEAGSAAPAPGTPTTSTIHSVKDLVAATNDRGRIVYRFLATSGGKPVSIDEISKAVGFTGPQTPGLLGSMGRSLWSRGFRTASCDADGWSWPDAGPDFPAGEGSTPPADVVWGWDGAKRTCTMPSAIAIEFLEALA